MAGAEVRCHHGCAHQAKLKNWPEAKALQCWRAPWELLGLLLSSGGQDHQEGLLRTTAFDPEKACSTYEKPGRAVKQRSWLTLELGQMSEYSAWDN